MKNIICSSLLFLYSFVCVSQIPIDSTTGLLTYSEVVQVDSSIKSNDLYFLFKEWFVKTYNSAKNVIQLDEKENNKIIGKGSLPIIHKGGLGLTAPGGQINYTITLMFKDGRFKYLITGFNHVTDGGLIPSFGPCESMLKSQNKKKSYQKTFDNYLEQVDSHVRSLINSLKLEAKTYKLNQSKDKW